MRNIAPPTHTGDTIQTAEATTHFHPALGFMACVLRRASLLPLRQRDHLLAGLLYLCEVGILPLQTGCWVLGQVERLQCQE